VYPSKAEGFGIPPLEAGAACVPVLCSHSTAMSDFHFFGDNLFDPKDDKVLKEKLISIITHPPDPSALKDISEKIKERYNWTTSAEKLYELL
jgi:glycosyltransferase involved in cell wall biosynthesis